MITCLYSIFDTKAKLYNLPFQFHNDKVAYRAAQDIMFEPNSAIAAHPEDYIMFKIGTYDDNTGIVTQFETKEVLVNFHHLDKPEQPAPLHAVIDPEDQPLPKEA